MGELWQRRQASTGEQVILSELLLQNNHWPGPSADARQLQAQMPAAVEEDL